MDFATTPEEIARYQLLLFLVDELRESADEGWTRISKTGIGLLLSIPALRGLGQKLASGDPDDDGRVTLEPADTDCIMEAAGVYLREAGPEEPDWDDPYIRFILASHRIDTGEGIFDGDGWDYVRSKGYWDDVGHRKYVEDEGPRPPGPITLEEHEKWMQELRKRLFQKLEGLRMRGVQ